MSSPTSRLKTLMENEPVVYAPGVWDGLSSILAEQAGYSALCSSGFAISASLGMPDAELYSVTENLSRVNEITASSRLPVIADIDTGSGNAVNVMRTVRSFERSGVAAVFMEDQVAPKRCPVCVGDPVPLIDVQEAASKIRAACDAREDPDLLVIARTDGVGADAIDRGQAYVEAGADLIFPVTKTFSSVDEWKECHERVGAPLLCCLTANTWVEKTFTPEKLEDAGVKIALLPTQILYGAVTGMRQALQRIYQGEAWEDVSADHIQHHEFADLIGFPAIEDLQEKYLPATSSATA